MLNIRIALGNPRRLTPEYNEDYPFGPWGLPAMGTAISDPYLDEEGRERVDPVEYYGFFQSEVDLLVKLNRCYRMARVTYRSSDRHDAKTFRRMVGFRRTFEKMTPEDQRYARQTLHTLYAWAGEFCGELMAR